MPNLQPHRSHCVQGKPSPHLVWMILWLVLCTLPIYAQSSYRVQEVMVPMRDGVHLQTVIITRTGQTTTLPILLERTPYGVPTQEDYNQHAAKEGANWLPDKWKELAADGYIFVIQNLRGRFKSEGVFLLTSQYDPTNPKQANETNDAYDTIDWAGEQCAQQ